eukprot:CAMPEP_0178991124 /NCGR_PEP_ID=MMETSP0795-20121207/5344_1 /TAXON_ID=88552 /ORGANISM="Amoebophrya sp., Strain Ameob2" /LENGTH=451 /DNA_ID=CAMNT_0020682779 /DNA_START=117 /DNA_END=1472 /DNA_ORIENTATION=+
MAKKMAAMKAAVMMMKGSPAMKKATPSRTPAKMASKSPANMKRSSAAKGTPAKSNSKQASSAAQISSAAKKRASEEAERKAERKKISAALDKVEAALVYGYGCARHPVLEKMLRPCMEVCESERGGLQRKGVDMLTKQVTDMWTVLQAKLQEKQNFLVNAPLVEADIEKTGDHLKQQLQNLTEQAQSLGVKLSEEENLQKQAEKGLKEAKQFKHDVYTALPLLKRQVKQVSEMEKGSFQPLLDNPPAAQSSFNKQMSLVKDAFSKIIALDESVLAALPAALRKAPSNRGAFDDVTLTEAKKQLRNWILDTEFKIANQAPREQDAEAKVKSAEEEVQRTGEQVQAARELMDVVEENLERNRGETRENEKRRKQHPKNVENAVKEKQEAEADVNKFNEVMTAFNFLKNRKNTHGEDDFALGDRARMLALQDSPREEDEESSRGDAMEVDYDEL